ncbi:hypothetical protein QFC24_003727 [Naganishia onofrii]|uniref:Uncharacterized protein n=1 Tax=Naganishia onofrii TaxID=1851511 RepID=A0ACC2XIQ7_9TREE|nr:hypothetical protein QFC24_003727 [Naganishia onofrii]
MPTTQSDQDQVGQLVGRTDDKHREESQEIPCPMHVSVLALDGRVDMFSSSDARAASTSTTSLDPARMNSVTVLFAPPTQSEAGQKPLVDGEPLKEQNERMRKCVVKKEEVVKAKEQSITEQEGKQAGKDSIAEEDNLSSDLQGSIQPLCECRFPAQASLEKLEKVDLSASVLRKRPTTSSSPIAFYPTQPTEPQTAATDQTAVHLSAFSLSLRNARIIKDIRAVADSSNALEPTAAPNDFAPPYKFWYNRMFLLQFGPVCQGEVTVEISLDVLGVDRRNPPKVEGLVRGGHQSTGLRGQTRRRGGCRSMAHAGTEYSRGKKSSAGNDVEMDRSNLVSFAHPTRMSVQQPDYFSDDLGRDFEVSQSARGERAQADGEGQKQFNTMHPAPISPGLEALDNRWNHAVQNRRPVQLEESSPEYIKRKVRSLLNKLTAERFDSISDQILEWTNKSVTEIDGQTLRLVIKLIFEKAKKEALWSATSAKLCRKL